MATAMPAAGNRVERVRQRVRCVTSRDGRTNSGRDLRVEGHAVEGLRIAVIGE